MGMVYDQAHQQVVMFGGQAFDFFGDTWTWDGTNWTKQQPSSSPMARWGPGMGYDQVDQNVMELESEKASFGLPSPNAGRVAKIHVKQGDIVSVGQTLLDIKDKTKIHTEITDLVIPEIGDNLVEARKLSSWLYDNLGPDVPIHFLRFHPDYKLMHLPQTPVETLEEHCRIARSVGLRYVYVGNVPGHPWEHTYCPGCGQVAIKRYGYNILDWRLDKENRCVDCGYRLPIVGRLSSSYKEDRFLPVLN